jgi:hypothetical protein
MMKTIPDQLGSYRYDVCTSSLITKEESIPQLNWGRHGRDLQLLITPFDIFNIFLYGQLQAKVALLVITAPIQLGDAFFFSN